MFSNHAALKKWMVFRMQTEKNQFRSFYAELLVESGAGSSGVAAKFMSKDCDWHGPYPIGQARGPEQFSEKVWDPIRKAFKGLTRQDDILICSDMQGESWIAATGHYYGTFVQDWLGIPANQQVIPLRYGEFARVKDGQLCEFRILFDLVAFCRRAGIHLLPASRGAEIDVPGPETGDGVILTPQEAQSTSDSLQLIEDLIEGLMSFDGVNLESMGMERFWTPNMKWYGPAGIGTTYGIDGFQKHHQGPFLKAFPDREGGNHVARIAEGNYAATTGWPSIQATHSGGYLGIPATQRRIVMRVMDWWRRDGDLLAENWVFIDLPHLFLQLGVDLLAEGLARSVQR
jgi:predicted ester cyclase